MPETPYALLGKSDAPAIQTVDAYRKQGGYTALQNALTSRTPEQVIAEVRAAGLRGRGGAGVLTAEKLTLVARNPDDTKYLICNAYDADPRSLIAETLLTNNPHLVFEGMALAAYAIGASEGYLYVNGRNKELGATLRDALAGAQEGGMLGRGIFSSSFSFAITLVGVELGFMGGEESSLIQVLKGRPLKAQQRPPYPTEYGLNDKPTVVQNVETLANLPLILSRGANAYRAVGSKATPGTKLITVIGPTGDASRQLVEVPFGASIRDVLKAASLTADESSVRAVAIGGMEGGALPLAQLTTLFDFESLEAAGVIVGSSIVEALPQDTCMVHWAMERSDYLSHESCGKCVPCRVGVKRIAGTLQSIESGIGVQGDLALLEEFTQYVPDGSLCGFGVNAVHPTVTAMKYFADDFAAHLDGRCPTGACIPVRAHRFVTKHVL